MSNYLPKYPSHTLQANLFDPECDVMPTLVENNMTNKSMGPKSN